MALLPEGWEADYDGTRWLYRYKATGLTQYHFPRSGDEFPELVGLGFGTLDGTNHSDVATKPGGNGPVKAASGNETDLMGATGYFDPDQFMYFGLNDVSPVGNENNTPTSNNEAVLAELPESERIQSPVGLVAELASSETAKCAEELAPIELDATQMAPIALRVTPQQNGPTELPTSRSPVEQKKPIQHPVLESMQPVEEYPLVSASFAYPPLKTATRPVDNVVQGSNSPSAEQKVLSSSRPVETWADQNKYETWKPGQGSATEELRDSNRKSTALSSISVLQSQNSELGSMDQKRHSLSGPIETSEATVDLPGILRRPSDPRKAAIVHTPSPQVESSQIPAVLQPATTPLRTDLPQNNPHHHRPQSSVSLPGSGARHESISFSPGLSIVNSSSYQMPSVLKPAQSISTSEVQTPGDAATNDNCIGIHKVNTFPNQISSHTSYLPKIGGPGIYVFQEISAAPRPTIEQVQSKPHNHSNEDASSQELHQATEPYYSILNEPLPVIAPLSVSKPQSPTSPNQTSENSSTPEESRPPNSQSSSIHSAIIGMNNVTLRPSVQNNSHNEGPASPAASSNETGAHPSQVNFPAISQGQTSSSSRPQQKLLRKPVLPQRPNTHIVLESPIAQPHPLSPQATPTTQVGQHILTYNQRPQSISGPSQHSTELPHNQPAPIQEHNHGLAMSIQVSGQASFSGLIANQAVAGQAGVVNSQSTTQKPPSNPSQVTPSIKPATQTASQVSNQNMPAGMNIGTNRPQQSWSPTVHPVSPLQSQVSSPTPSIASLHRPPSSASSHTQPTTQGIIPQSRPPTTVTHQNTSQAPRPTGPQVIHSQGHAQGTQSPNAPGNASKPFPMLPGQVKPMPSQVGSSPIPIAAQPGQTGPIQAPHPLTQVPPMKPTQHQGIQQVSQLAVQRPPQQQLIQGHHMQVAGQNVPGTVYHGQPRPPVSAQQYIPAHVPQNTQTQGPYTHQGVGQISQSPSGQQTVSFAQGTHVQQHVSQTVQYPNAANISAAQSFHTGQPASQIQGQQHQQPTQTPSYQPGSSQVYGQGKPFNSAQATAAFSDAGKKMKKWAKKTWQNPTFKQATAAVGGAVFAESLGGNGVAGAALANQIYTNSQNKPQNNQPQRPPGPQHANTAPPQAQHPTGMNATAQYGQAVNRPQLQQGAQPPGFQPGRPPVVQNPGVVGTAMNNNPPQPQVGMMNQQPVYQMSRPPVGRPPVTQAQQPATFSQPFYQGAPGQPIFQASPNQPLYQMHSGQQVYQARPGQPPLQAQDSTDTYAAIGATIGGALNALASGKPDSGAPAGSQQHHHTAGSEPQHESHPPQHHEPYPEPHHEAHSEQPYEGQSGEHHTEHATHQESYADQQNMAYSESQTTDPQVVMDNPTSEAYFAPQSDTTIINNTTINNVDNTAIAQSQQVNMNYTDNTNITDTSNMNSGTNAFVEDSSYMLDTSSANTQATAFTDTAYTDTAYIDATNMNTDTTSYGGSTYVDASYAGASYSDMAYVDNTTMVDVNVDMNVNVDMSANYNDMTYTGDQMSTMDMQESVSVDASYAEESTVDYSGGDWGGGDW
ncbi:uncharacterized protein F4807DRAFT_455578 [Annulohypoxylon truncatum]|uniref:uncharacterized protein n=1 Tax=Annulohypoxylon truncatum TaxID=327061 RepID=UPI002007CFFB|nr:uncharacterized protein F4807DRAFT_455578 [Annulohypoxylon truncatum]KAI1215127.1 hypothetical protein F4807DRAFT_455578 [Annulohypoxylon truncatum]